jgi:hypothetical protein
MCVGGQVVQALRKVASLGRSIVCTIHQPSAELFFHFDDLLLLQVCDEVWRRAPTSALLVARQLSALCVSTCVCV